MVKVKYGEHEYYMDGILKDNLDRVKGLVRKDWDAIYIVDGEVGSGKSVFTQQLAHYCSEGVFSNDMICFTPEGFRESILKAPRYGAVVFDEAFRGLSGRSAMTQTNRAIVGLLNEIRQKNLFVFIVLPSVWDLDSYVGKHRCRGLFHVYTDKAKNRGFMRFYNKRAVLTILKDWKHRYSYPAKMSFYGKFVKYQPVDVKEYKAKKLKALGTPVERKSITQQRYQAQRDALLTAVADEFKVKAGFLSALLNKYSKFPLEDSQINKILRGTRESISPLRGESLEKPLLTRDSGALFKRNLQELRALNTSSTRLTK